MCSNHRFHVALGGEYRPGTPGHAVPREPAHERNRPVLRLGFETAQKTRSTIRHRTWPVSRASVPPRRSASSQRAATGHGARTIDSRTPSARAAGAAPPGESRGRARGQPRRQPPQCRDSSSSGGRESPAAGVDPAMQPATGTSIDIVVVSALTVPPNTVYPSPRILLIHERARDALSSAKTHDDHSTILVRGGDRSANSSSSLSPMICA